VKSRNLVAIRSFYDGYRKDGLSGAERFSEMAYKLSGVRYAIMTNIPFDSVRIELFHVCHCNGVSLTLQPHWIERITALETKKEGKSHIICPDIVFV
jgi:hypothetical protein